MWTVVADPNTNPIDGSGNIQMLMEDHEKGKKHPGTMRRHMKGDALCSVILLFLFFLLFYSHRRLTPQRDQTPPAKHGTTRHTPVPETNTDLPKSPQIKPHPPDPPNIKAPRPSDAPRPISTAVPPSHTSFDFADYLRKKDQRDFKLLIDQPAKCSEPDGPFLLIAVKSLASEFDKRQVVRRTWGREGIFQKKASVRRLFLLGVPQNQSALPLWDRLLAYESRSYGDILLWDFEDTFFNLTLKEIHFLRWVNTSCPQAKFLFKGDADVFVNVDNVLQMLESQEPHQDLFVGDIIVNAKPIRRRTSKYFVPEFIYGQGVYPTYAGGGGFVMSGHTARKLQRACGEVELFPIDDVFLGMCLLRIGLQPTRHQGFRTFGIVRPSAAPHLQIFEPCFYRELMVVHSLTVPQIWLMWKLLHDPDLHCHGKQRLSPFPFRWGGKGEKSQAEARNDDYGMKVFVEH